MPEQHFQSFGEGKNLPQQRRGKAAVVPGLGIPSDGEEHARGAVMSWEGDTHVPACTWYFTNRASRCYSCCPFILAPVNGLEEAM